MDVQSNQGDGFHVTPSKINKCFLVETKPTPLFPLRIQYFIGQTDRLKIRQIILPDEENRSGIITLNWFVELLR